MAGMSSPFAADAAPLLPPPEPTAVDGHGGGGAAAAADNDNNTWTIERFPDLFKQKVLVHLKPIDRTFVEQVGSACRAAVGGLRLDARGDEKGGAGEDGVDGDALAPGLCRDRGADGLGKGERLPVGSWWHRETLAWVRAQP
jgi:hypothetical protein